MVNTGIVPRVSRGGTAKLRNLRERPRATLVFRSGWDWMAGPDDALPGMPADRRAAVLVDPRRFSTNPAPHDRED